MLVGIANQPRNVSLVCAQTAPIAKRNRSPLVSCGGTSGRWYLVGKFVGTVLTMVIAGVMVAWIVVVLGIGEGGLGSAEDMTSAPVEAREPVGESTTHETEEDAIPPSPAVSPTATDVNEREEVATASTTHMVETHDDERDQAGAEPTTDTVVTQEENVLQWYYLSDVRPVLREITRSAGCTGGCAGFNHGSARVGGETFANSVILRVDSRGPVSLSRWNLARSCTTLVATVGLRDDTIPHDITFSYKVDGGLEQKIGTLMQGDSEDVELDVSGIASLELRASADQPTGRFTYDQVRAVWGDAAVSCASGSLG